MRIATEKDIRIIDQMATEKYAMPSYLLMEGAGLALANVVKEHLDGMKRVIVIVGMGNNGGDGIVCARHLHNAGFDVSVYLIGNIKKLSEDAVRHYEMLKPLEIVTESINDNSGIKKMGKRIRPGDLVVDCLFGIGIQREIEGVYQLVVEEINASNGYVIACDIPSGIKADDAIVMGCAVKADETVAMCLPKIGNIMYPGAAYNGILKVADIGIPRELINEVPMTLSVISEDIIRNIIPKREKNTHKGSYGKAVLIAGTYGMTGAAILASTATLRSGVGLLRLIIPESLYTVITSSVPEAVIIPISETRRGVFAINQIEKIIKNCENADVVAIGPGCGQSSEISEVLRQLFTEVEIPIVIDADGLNTLSKNIDLINNATKDIVMTPHPGEMSRLTGLTIEQINMRPIEIAIEYAKKWHVTIVLKGAKTVVATKTGAAYVNHNGNPGMATAGSGDVLTGIITALIAQGVSPEKAAIAGVYLHGSAGDFMAEVKGEYGLIAGDIVEGLTKAFMKVLYK